MTTTTFSLFSPERASVRETVASCIKTHCTMSTQQKDWVSKWLPLIVSIMTSVGTVAYAYGRLEQRLAPMEAFMRENSFERHAQVFTPRTEFHAQKSTRDRELDELKGTLREINSKLDRLIERGR